MACRLIEMSSGKCRPFCVGLSMLIYVLYAMSKYLYIDVLIICMSWNTIQHDTSEAHQLQSMDISSSMLKHLDPAIYPLILPSSLIHIFFDYGNLPSFPNISYLVPQWETLIVSNNDIPVIPQESTANLIELRKFHANENRLKTIPDLFYLRKLQKFNIKTTAWRIYHQNTSKVWRVLFFFGANHNNTVRMPNVSGLEKIVALRLDDNWIRYVPASCLYGLKNLQS